MGNYTKRDGNVFIVKCIKRKNSIDITVPKKQVVNPYKLVPGDFIILEFKRKINKDFNGGINHEETKS